ncbi:MAG: prolyl oligopeptidase family serine peptidase, partial [Gammaproteobacteria bacterium]
MIEKQKATFGSWESPITTDLMLQDSVGLGEISIFKNEIYWIEMRPQEKGRYVIVKQTTDGEYIDVIPPEYNARTRVHEYGGGSYLITEKGVVFTNFSDQALYLIDTDNNCIQLTDNESCRYADMIYDKFNNRLICVREDHADEKAEAKTTIVAVSLDQSLSDTDKERVLVEGADFYSNPRLSHDGKSLCWISWNHPNMPWDNTSLTLAKINQDGELTEPIHVAGGDDKNEAVCQPVWSPENILYFLSDRNNWWNLYRVNDNEVECVLEMDAEFAVPQWSFREVNYDFVDGNNIVAIYRQNGLAYLSKVIVSEQSVETLTMPYTDLESISCNEKSVCFLAASPTEFPTIIEYDLETNKTKVIRKANNLNLDEENISIGKSLSFPVDEINNAYAFFYKPKNKTFTGLDGEKPPLIVMSHGGPTGESHNGIKMVAQFFSSRGFAVLDVNYGGSSGYGRAYRQRLNKEWGIVDVNDCSKAAL